MVHGAEVLRLADLGHIWGQGVEEPLVAITNIRVDKNNLGLFGSTLKIALPSDEGISLVKFRSSNEEYESLYSDSGCVMVDIVGTCAINDYYGNITAQILIDDYNIVKRHKYYF